VEGGSVYSLLLGSQSYEVLVQQAGDEYTITLDGDRFTVRVADERHARSSQGQTYGQRGTAPGGAADRQAAEQGAVISPMTGVLLEVLVQEGQVVEVNDRVALLEAMKTENVIRASRSGVVRDIQVTAGQTLRMDAVILYIDEPQS
jgi:biotin carboxyl carrier protein